MNMFPSTSEIVESTEGLSFKLKMDGGGQPSIRQFGNRYCIEDDINRLFESIDIRTSAKSFNAKQKKAMKRPIRAGSPQISGIGISEPVSLKQALRGLCISQASEMAALKRLSKPGGSSGAGGSEVGTIKRLYRSLVVEANRSVLPLNEGNGKLVEVSLVPEQIPSNSGQKTFNVSEIAKLELSGPSSHVSQEEIVPLSAGFTNKMLKEGAGEVKLTDSFPENHVSKKLQVVDEIPSSSVSALVETRGAEGQENQLHMGSFQSSLGPGSMMSNFACNSPRFIRPIFRNKSFVRKKLKQASASASSRSNSCSRQDRSDLDPSTSNAPRRRCDCSQEDGNEENIRVSPASSDRSHDLESNSATADTCSSKRSSSLNNSNRTRSILSKIDERSRSRDKGEFSQSSKSSIGEYSSTTSISEDSILSGSSCSGNRPHMSRDLRWEAIRLVQKHHGSLALKHFKLIKKLGCGDIGSVHLAELTGTNCLFALKVMDNDFLESRKKIIRAQTEKEILQILNHPFLPTLYAHFVSDKLSCLVMEYCPGGDLHVLRQKQPGRSFSERAARFYIAEILLAIEYLHMLGVVYRDLKPENILVREDGHIMLSDFDLSLRCAVNTVVVQSSSSVAESTKKMSSPCSESSCIDPFCFQPACQASCFTPRLLSVASKSRKFKSDLAVQVTPLPQLVVEPTSARSNSFVGTHEYLAPEIIKGEGHGSAVDWWTFGIFLFELLYGRTPFKGSTSEGTLSNVATRSLKFPSSPIVSFHARDLIRGLLIKDPEHRLGSAKGAAEIKQHPFFDGLNWALIRCATPPPELPKNDDHNQKCKESSDKGTSTAFEMF